MAKVATIDEAKDVRDKAEAVRRYAKTAGESLELQNACAEIKLRAERRAGDLLGVMEKNKGAAHPTRSHDATTLSDLNITKSQSSRWQTEASVPDAIFEEFLEAANAAEVESEGSVDSGGVRVTGPWVRGFGG